MWIYDNVQEVAAAPYSEYTAAIEQRKADNVVALEEAVADLASAMSSGHNRCECTFQRVW